MIGINKLILNEATMLVAVQEYLDKRYSEGVDAGPRVTNINMDHSNGKHFEVVLQGKPS